jgi:hypothetical protein
MNLHLTTVVQSANGRFDSTPELKEAPQAPPPTPRGRLKSIVRASIFRTVGTIRLEQDRPKFTDAAIAEQKSPRATVVRDTMTSARPAVGAPR